MGKRRGNLRRRERGRCEEERSLHCLGGRLGVAQGTHHLYIRCIFRWFSAYGASSLYFLDIGVDVHLQKRFPLYTVHVLVNASFCRIQFNKY